MDVREKLVEILENSFEKQYEERCLLTATHTAEDLIANGVTVQECGRWVSFTECTNAGVYCSVCHKKVYKEDYAWCNRKNKLRSAYCPNCGAKMIPQPPKVE